MSDAERPKIEFPCADYPIKVLGVAGDELRELVVSVMSRHDPSFDSQSLKENASSKGRFTAYTAMILATGETQLQNIYQELKQHSAVKMVL